MIIALLIAAADVQQAARRSDGDRLPQGRRIAAGDEPLRWRRIRARRQGRSTRYGRKCSRASARRQVEEAAAQFAARLAQISRHPVRARGLRQYRREHLAADQFGVPRGRDAPAHPRARGPDRRASGNNVQENPDRQSRGDCVPGDPHRAADGDQDGRGLFRRRRARAAREDGGRERAARAAARV